MRCEVAKGLLSTAHTMNHVLHVVGSWADYQDEASALFHR